MSDKMPKVKKHDSYTSSVSQVHGLPGEGPDDGGNGFKENVRNSLCSSEKRPGPSERDHTGDSGTGGTFMGRTVCCMLVVYKLTSPGRLPLCFPTSCHTLHPFTVHHKRNPQMPMSSRSFQGYMPFFTRQTLTRAWLGTQGWDPGGGAPSQVSHQSPSPRWLSQRHTSACRVSPQPGAGSPAGAWEAAAGRKRSLGLWRGVIQSSEGGCSSEPPRTAGSCGTGQVTLWVACRGRAERPHAQSHRKVTARAVGR